MIEIVAEARSFLHHQVRNMAGTLKLVGEGRWRAGDVAAGARGARPRRRRPDRAGRGLCLTDVGYPHDPFSPDPA